jgi:hypothetical protein
MGFIAEWLLDRLTSNIQNDEPGLNPNILLLIGILGAADEAVINAVYNP